jgi:hypothetical protein
MNPVNNLNLFSIVMRNLGHNLQLVEGCQCLIEVEIEELIFYMLIFFFFQRPQRVFVPNKYVVPTDKQKVQIIYRIHKLVFEF